MVWAYGQVRVAQCGVRGVAQATVVLAYGPLRVVWYGVGAALRSDAAAFCHGLFGCSSPSRRVTYPDRDIMLVRSNPAERRR